jgi:catechol 2,3-dioxygenase-like lactoylglutathione lyase family enzyme
MSGLHHVALRVRDCGVSARFYTQAFGLREIRRSGDESGLRAVWLDAFGTVLMLERAIRGHGASEGSGHVLVFPCADLDAAIARLETLGIPVTDRTTATLYVEDPDGHRAGLSVYAFGPPTAG